MFSLNLSEVINLSLPFPAMISLLVYSNISMYARYEVFLDK